MPTAIVTNPDHGSHDEACHVEQAARLQAIEKAIDLSGLRPDLVALTARPATQEQILAVHHQRVLDLVRRATSQQLWIDQDTYTTPESLYAALTAAGGAVQAIDAVLSGKAQNAFALGRPPGHHATPTRSMGFCLFNNIAVAARYACTAYGLERVAIIDYDVHHGNGTQDIFLNDKRVLFCSTHAAPLYPGTGTEHEIGVGTTLNLPLAYGTGDTGFERLYDEVLAPALRHFQPQLIMVSAGYDGHWADPLGPLTLSVAGYAGLTQRLRTLAEELCGGKIVLVLEGGYDRDALGACVVASLRVLMGRDPGMDPLGLSNQREPDVSALIERTLHTHPLLQA